MQQRLRGKGTSDHGSEGFFAERAEMWKKVQEHSTQHQIARGWRLQRVRNQATQEDVRRDAKVARV